MKPLGYARVTMVSRAKLPPKRQVFILVSLFYRLVLSKVWIFSLILKGEFIKTITIMTKECFAGIVSEVSLVVDVSPLSMMLYLDPTEEVRYVYFVVHGRNG